MLALIPGIIGLASSAESMVIGTTFPTSLDSSPCPRNVAESRLLNARRLVVQLQKLRVEPIFRASPDVLVVDYSWDGGETREMTPENINDIRGRLGKGTILLAYLSVGEAEDYRFYWRGPALQGQATFVGPANPRWPGNYRVRYWDRRWHDIVYGAADSYLARIISQGFDGVFLDTVDTTAFFTEAGVLDAEERMADLVSALAVHARRSNPGFLVVAQNPFHILDRPGVIDAISGVSIEATMFNGERLRPPREVTGILARLDTLQDAGKTVMILEYPRSSTGRKRLGGLCARHGFLCYSSNSALDRVGHSFEKRRRQEAGP